MWRFLNAYFEEILGSFLLALMAGIAFVNVVVRYCTSFSFAWTEEMTVNFFVWVTLLGTALAFRDGSNLAMTLFYQMLPRAGRKCCLVLICLLGLIFFGSLAWIGMVEVLDEIVIGSISESMGIPVWWYTIATPVFSVLIIFRMFQRTWQDWKLKRF